MIKLAVFDLDGTLCPIGGSIASRDIALLHALKDRGLSLAICSGKTTFYLCGLVRQIGITDMILLGENGSEIQFGIDLPPATHCTLPYDKKVKAALRKIKDDIEEMVPGVWMQPNSVVFTPFLTTPEQFDMVQNYIDTNPDLLEGIDVFRHEDCFDFVPAGINKYEGLKKLAEMLDIDQDEIVAVGNGSNDLPMFQFAGTSIGICLPDVEEVDIHVENITDALHQLEQLLEKE